VKMQSPRLTREVRWMSKSDIQDVVDVLCSLATSLNVRWNIHRSRTTNSLYVKFFNSNSSIKVRVSDHTRNGINCDVNIVAHVFEDRFDESMRLIRKLHEEERARQNAKLLKSKVRKPIEIREYEDLSLDELAEQVSDFTFEDSWNGR
jgi:hypothetical protein